MNDLNSLLIEGRLTKDPEGKALANGTKVCNFGIAINRSVKQGTEYANEVSYFDVEIFGRNAEAVLNYCEKGRGVRITGRLKQERWTDKQNQPRSKVKIVAEHIEFMHKARANNEVL